MSKTFVWFLLFILTWIYSSLSQTPLRYYGVDDIEMNEYLFLKDSLKGNFALVELQPDTLIWKNALNEAEKNNLKLIIWPLGHGQRYTTWKYDVLKWDWDISEGENVLQFAERYITSGGKALLAVVMTHEPFYSQNEMIFTSSQLKLLYSAIKEVAPHVQTYIYMNDMAYYDSTDAYRQMEDGIMDICGTYKHSFGTKHTEEETLNEIDADRYLIDRKGLHMQLFFALQAFGYDTPDYDMPTAAEMLELATKILEKGKLDGAFWYPWNKVSTNYTSWLHHNRYDSLGMDRWSVVTELSRYLAATDVKENAKSPTQFSLSQNYPNPFNPATAIEFSVVESGVYIIKVYDLLGQEVAQLFNDTISPGFYKVNFDGNGLSSGIYFYTLTGGNTCTTKKMILLK